MPEEIEVDVYIEELDQSFKTPFSMEIDPGTYTLKATYNAQEQTKTAEITAGVKTTVEFTFVAPPPVEHILTIEATIGGTTNPTPGTYTHPENTTVQVTAIPDESYNFNHWILDGIEYTTNPITIVMDSDHTLTAYFSEEPPPPPETYNLTVSTTLGGTTDPTPNIYEYDAGATATVTAFPENGYYFRFWELDGVERTENPINVLMDRDYLLRAVFSTVAPPPPVEINLPIIGGIAVVVVDAALILYYIATHISRKP